MPTDYLLRCSSIEQKLRIIFVDCSVLSKQLCKVHHLEEPIFSVYSEILCSGLLTSPLLNEGERYTIRWQYDGPIQSTLIDVAHNAQIRGTTDHSFLKGITSTQQALGESGKVGVVKSTPYRKLNSGMTLADLLSPSKDLATFFHLSDQIPTAIKVIQKQNITLGFMIQALPECSPETIAELQNFMDTDEFSHSCSKLNIASEKELHQLFSTKKLKTPINDISCLEKTTPKAYCSCSKDKMIQALSSFPDDDLKCMIKEDGGAQIDCQFCEKNHIFDTTDLMNIINSRN